MRGIRHDRGLVARGFAARMKLPPHLLRDLRASAQMMKGSLAAMPRGSIRFWCGQLYSSRSGQLLVSAEA